MASNPLIVKNGVEKCPVGTLAGWTNPTGLSCVSLQKFGDRAVNLTLSLVPQVFLREFHCDFRCIEQLLDQVSFKKSVERFALDGEAY